MGHTTTDATDLKLGRLTDAAAWPWKRVLNGSQPKRDVSVPWRTPTVLKDRHSIWAAWQHWSMAVHMDILVPPAQREATLAVHARTLVGHRMIRGYAYATTINRVIAGLCHGPVLAMTDWHESMEKPDLDGYAAAGGPVLRKLAYVITAYKPQRQSFRIQPALGAGWGEAGRAWLADVDLDYLLVDGEALVALR